MADLITRQMMMDAMQDRFMAQVSEPSVRHWRNVDVVVMRQTKTTCAGMLDFHLVEQCLQGRARSGEFMRTERGDHVFADHVPGALSYFQNGVAQDFQIEGEYVVQQIYIDKSVFRATAASLAKGDPDAVGLIGFQGVFDPNLKALADALLEEARNPSAGDDLYVDELAQQIAVLILRRQRDLALRQTQRRRTLSSDELTRVSDHLESDLADTGGLDTLATLLDMDAFAFSRAFKETTGLAPHQYLIERRIARVKDMLLADESGLADIAYATGFSSQSHMTATFTQRVGLSPGKWRTATKAGSAG
ncbi:MAG: AraC family transcriptional regulator [Pseudomonadota bacterium]